jgi:two-component system, NarL family, sensor histidine kinase UhpB
MHPFTNLLKNRAGLPQYSPPIMLTAIYVIVSIVWIQWSDTLVMQIANNNSALLTQLQSKKGFAFIIFSGSLLYFISNYFCKRALKSNQQKCSLEQKLNGLNIAIRGGMIDYDVELKKALINDKMKFFFPSIHDTVPDFLLLFLERIHQDDRERVRNEYDAVILSAQDVWTTEYKVLGSDSNYYTVISSIFLIRNNQGSVHRLIGEMQDISQLRNLQAEHYKQILKHKQALARTIIKAQENERNRWAQELHDNISQILTVINLYLSNTKVKIDNNVLMISESKKMISEVQQEIRFLSASMKPPTFASMTLQQTIERLILDVTRTKTNKFYFTSAEFDETILNDDQKLLIYRVVQEQLNNIIKYANADVVEIDLKSNNNCFYINITDNGTGFDQTNIKTGLGFRNMQSRLALYNGEMQLKSSPGNGCSLAASFQT